MTSTWRLILHRGVQKTPISQKCCGAAHHYIGAAPRAKIDCLENRRDADAALSLEPHAPSATSAQLQITQQQMTCFPLKSSR